MLISYKYKFIYIKTHKTASTSIEGLLEPLCAPPGHIAKHRQGFLASDEGVIAGRAGGELASDPLSAHAPASKIEAYIGAKKFRAYTKIIPVRNPFDKTVSWFWHVMPADTRKEMRADFGKARALFRNWLRMRPVLPTDLQYYETATDTFAAQLIRYENLEQDLKLLSDKLKLNLDLDRLPAWKTARRPNKQDTWHAYYDADTADVVLSEFKKDFQRLGYPRSFEPDQDGSTEVQMLRRLRGRDRDDAKGGKLASMMSRAARKLRIG